MDDACIEETIKRKIYMKSEEEEQNRIEKSQAS